LTERRSFTRALALAVTVIALILGTLIFAATSAQAANDPHKVLVCKYVDGPGRERIQTGQNPIVVDTHSLKGFNGTFPYVFVDHQVASVAVRFLKDGESSGTKFSLEAECPFIPGEEPTPTPTPSQTVTVTPSPEPTPEQSIGTPSTADTALSDHGGITDDGWLLIYGTLMLIILGSAFTSAARSR
jgi:hypothetical protein